MTTEDKELLLKDLCARFPYGVKIDREWIAPMSGSPEHCTVELDTFDIEIIKTSIELGKEGNCRDGKMKGLTTCDDGNTHFVRGYIGKPYLRPMSSMTEDERLELSKITHCNILYINDAIGVTFKLLDDATFLDNVKAIDYLNSHHFDYRGLIEKGLALPASEGMYERTR